MESKTERLIAAHRALYSETSQQAPIGWAEWLDHQIRLAAHRGAIAKRVSLTPLFAQELILRNPHNRTRSEAVVSRYARDLKEGRWVFNGEPIIVASDGTLTDGQHRVHAVIAADCAMDTMMVFGVDPKTRTTTDQGRSKTAGDYLEMGDLRIPNSKLTASAARMHFEVMKYGKVMSGYGYAPTKGQIVEHVLSMKEQFAEAIAACKVSKTQEIVNPSISVCVFVVLKARFGILADEFMEMFSTGRQSEHGEKCPVFALREKFRSKKDGARYRALNPNEYIRSFFVAFKFFVQGMPTTARSIQHSLVKENNKAERIVDILDEIKESWINAKLRDLGIV